MKLLLIFPALLFPGFSYGQINFKLKDANKYVGDSIKVCGTVAGIYYSEMAQGHPTFLNLVQPYPKQDFTIVIWENLAEQFEKPLDAYLRKKICVVGVLTMYQNKPQIILTNKEQITLMKQ